VQSKTLCQRQHLSLKLWRSVLRRKCFQLVGRRVCECLVVTVTVERLLLGRPKSDWSPYSALDCASRLARLISSAESKRRLITVYIIIMGTDVQLASRDNETNLTSRRLDSVDQLTIARSCRYVVVSEEKRQHG
jgi:hypothetical protein